MVGKITVVHDLYGCESGCCGHRVQVSGDDALAAKMRGRGWFFEHPYSRTHEEFIRDLVIQTFGVDALPLIDYDNCRVSED